ncbi:hypothetical protein HMPREF1870_02476 [Bacteroidales bacterium KA00344]|nr:hypothetical protein HMPREF1870_02476 [Bacteroidales bacterium KA00344]
MSKFRADKTKHFWVERADNKAKNIALFALDAFKIITEKQ